MKTNYKQRKKPQTSGYELKLKLGKVNKVSPEEVNLLTASDCLNVLPLLNGELDKRKGFSLAVNSPATGRITSLFKFERPSATEELITTLTGLYKRNGTGTTGLKTNFTSSTVYNIVNYNELAIVFNGKDDIQKYNGTTVAALGGTPPKASFGAVIQDRLWIAGITGSENLFRWSEGANPELWPADHVNNLYTTDGDAITSVIGHLGQPTFLKQHSLHVMYGTDEDSYNPVEKSGVKGTVAHKSVRVHPEKNILIRLAADMRVWGWTGSQDICLSKDIDLGINSTYASKAVSWIDDRGFYWLAVPTGLSTECNSIFVLVFEQDSQTWQCYPVDVPWDLSAMGWFNGLLTLGRVDGIIDWEQAAYNDENAAIDAYWESQFLSGSAAEYFKQFTTLAVEAKPVAGATLAVSWTDETGAAGMESVDLGVTDVFVSEILYPQSFAKRLKIKVRNNELNKGLSVYSLTGKYIQKSFG